MRSTHTASPAGAAVIALVLLLASCGDGDVAATVEAPHISKHKPQVSSN